MTKKLLLAIALTACFGAANATYPGNNGGGNGGCGVGQQTNGCGSSSSSTGGNATATSNSNATGGSATGGSVIGGNAQTTSGAATTNSGAIVNTSAGGAGGSVKDSGNSTNLNSNKQGQLQGQQQSVNNSGNSTNVIGVSTKGTVGDVSSTSGVKNSGNSLSVSKGGDVKNSGNSTISEGAVKNNNANVNVVSTKGTVGNVSTGDQANAQTTNVGGQTTSLNIDMADNQFTVEAARAAAEAGNRGTEDAAALIAAATIQADAIKHASEQKIRNTPSVNGPALTSSNDTCMGSTSGSANAPGIGIGFGTSWVDGNCKMLKNSRELWNMGFKAAALALMCNDADNRQALEDTGFECPATAKKKAAEKQAASAPAVEYTDPIVRARLGLPTLAAAK